LLTVFLASGNAFASTRVVTPARALNELAARTPDAANAAYGHGFGTINMEDSTLDVPEMGTPVYGFSTVRTFKAATIESGSWVMYDLEWTPDQVENPDWQLRYPKAAIRSFLTVAHSRGLKVILTVGLGVVEKVPTAACQRRKHEPLVDAFLQCGIVAAANKFHAEKLMVLTQRYVCDPPKYRAATTQIADAFTGPVYAEMSVLPARDCISARRIYWNYRHVADAGAVQGLALWTSGQSGERPYEGQLVMAQRVLELLAAGT
jgi:hypothetical protein